MDDGHDHQDEEEQKLALQSLLRWYAAMGVDAPVDDTPHDRFIAVTAPAAPRAPTITDAIAPQSRRPPAVAAVTRPADVLVAEAEALAAAAVDLADLQSRWATVPGCTLATSSRMIDAIIPSGVPLLLIGGTPSEHDERAGAIFAGASGRLLDAMLRTIGLARTDIGLAHVVPWRPPGNRLPTPYELALCLPFCRRMIALAEPRLILCLGERAAQPLLGTRDPLSRLRGRWLSYEGDMATVKTLVTFAPGFLLGQPLQKRRAWTDLLMLEAELDGLRPRRS